MTLTPSKQTTVYVCTEDHTPGDKEYQSVESSETPDNSYKTIMWAFMTLLLVLLVASLIINYLICRHYRWAHYDAHWRYVMIETEVKDYVCCISMTVLTLLA